MKKCALFMAPLLCLVLPSVALPEVRIPNACRIANLPSGRCGWCALETLARHLGIEALYGVADKYPPNSRPRDLESVVAANRIKYHIQSRGCMSTTILQDAVRQDLGAMIGFRPLVSGGRGHIVTLVDFTDERVRILDPNDKDGRVRTLDLDTFLERWDGFALVLERP